MRRLTCDNFLYFNFKITLGDLFEGDIAGIEVNYVVFFQFF